MIDMTNTPKKVILRLSIDDAQDLFDDLQYMLGTAPSEGCFPTSRKLCNEFCKLYQSGLLK